VAGLVGWVALGQVVPRSTGAKYPEDAVQDVAWVSPGPALAVCAVRGIRDQRFHDFPLLVGKVHDVYSPVFLRAARGPLYDPSRVYEMVSSLQIGHRLK
jgi:hypothetical protein